MNCVIIFFKNLGFVLILVVLTGCTDDKSDTFKSTDGGKTWSTVAKAVQEVPEPHRLTQEAFDLITNVMTLREVEALIGTDKTLSTWDGDEEGTIEQYIWEEPTSRPKYLRTIWVSFDKETGKMVRKMSGNLHTL